MEAFARAIIDASSAATGSSSPPANIKRNNNGWRRLKGHRQSPQIGNARRGHQISKAADTVAVGARFGMIAAKSEDWRREKPGDPLGVFLAASLKV
jgi:hypothetical protein